ncbi:MAG: hypothetical protein N3G80_03895 [Candidatus Micrarchaeota archaeon]|nr:hypothetical protein [Candidatus Micrarchaeota archaeon]
MKAQLSAEMLIILVIILGIAVLVATTMLRSANKAAATVEQKADKIMNMSDSAAKGQKGAFCVSDEDCESGFCDPSAKRCS